MKKAKPLITTKVSLRTLQLARRVARKTEEKQYKIIERAMEAMYGEAKEKPQ